MDHNYLVTNPHALVQQIALLARTGYVFWTSGMLADDSDPAAFDRKLAEKYGLGRSKYQNYRAKKKELGRVKYLRCGRRWWLLAAKGDHPVFREERLRDIRESPVLVYGYAVGLYDGRVSVRIERDTYKRLKESFGKVAVGASATWLESHFWKLPFEPWFGVRQQAFQLLAFVNQQRKKAGLLQLDHAKAIRDKKRTFKVFATGDEDG